MCRGQVREGPFIEKFEKKFSEFYSTKYALTASSCRTLFYLIVKALNIAKGDEVILPAYNMSIFPKILQLNGIKPVFVDIDAGTLNVDVAKLEAVVTPRTKAIVVVHLFGNPCDMDPIMRMARKYDLAVIEDCANAIAAEYKGKFVGTFGDVACFSFGHSKDIPTFGGGMLITNNESLYKEVRRIYDEEFTFPSKFSVIKMLLKSLLVKLAISKVFFPILLYPLIVITEYMNSNILSDFFQEKDDVLKSISKKKYTNFQASIGMHYLDEMRNWQGRRIAHARIYDKILGKVDGVGIPEKLDGVKHVYWAYPIWLENRSKVMRGLIKHGIDSSKVYMYDCNGYAIFREFKRDCLVSGKASSRILELPIYHFLKTKDIEFIAEMLINSLGRDKNDV